MEGAALTTSAANPGHIGLSSETALKTLVLHSVYLLSSDTLKVQVGNIPVIVTIWNNNLKAAFSLNKHLPTITLNKYPSSVFQVAPESGTGVLSNFYLSQC